MRIDKNDYEQIDLSKLETDTENDLDFQNELLNFDLDKGTTKDIDNYRVKKLLISDITINGFKNITNLNIKLEKADEVEKAKSIIILGDNGSGKTSILQAITLTLLGSGAEDIISRLSLKPKFFLRRKDYNYIEKCNVKIKLTTDNEDVEKLELNKENFLWNNNGRKLPILAYGATRLLSKSRISKQKYKGLRIDNLFKPTSRLVNAEVWLKRLYKKNLRAFKIVADDILRKILVLDENQKIEKNHHNKIVIDDIPINQWSAGNKSVTALVCDILMAMSELWKDYELKNITDYTAIVLIDEIELHLHPSWKIKIFQLLRDTFPEIQFIITTHDPLCLRGAEKGEVHIIRKNNNKTEIIQKDIPNGNFIDQLLTGDWFRLNSTLDKETLGLMENHRLLAIKQNLSMEEKNEMLEYEKELYKALGVFADNTYFGIYKQVLKDLQLDKEENELSEQEINSVKNKFKELLK